MKTAWVIGLLLGACVLPPALADRISAPPARERAQQKPDYFFKPVPFTLSSWDSNSWAVEARVSGLVRAEGRRLILTFGDPAVIRRTELFAKDPPTVITSLQVLLVSDGTASFSTIVRSAKVPVGRALPPGRAPLEVEMPEEMTIELEREPTGPLSPGLANTFLKLAVIMPGRDDKGVEHAEWRYCYADAPRTLFADLLVDGGHRAVCARADPTPQREEPRDSPLEEAVRKGDPAAARMLLRAGADPNRRTHVYTPFELAAADGLAELIEPMLEAGARRDALARGIPVNTPGDRGYFHGITPFMSTAVKRTHNAEWIERWLKAAS